MEQSVFPFGISEARTGGVYKQLLLSKRMRLIPELNKIKIINKESKRLNREREGGKDERGEGDKPASCMLYSLFNAQSRLSALPA